MDVEQHRKDARNTYSGTEKYRRSYRTSYHKTHLKSVSLGVMNSLREVTRRAITAQSFRQATNASLTDWGHTQVSSVDPWRPVHDRESGMTYYWNTLTDETTALGAPSPSVRDPHPRFTTSRTSELIQMGFIGFGFGLVIAVVHKIL